LIRIAECDELVGQTINLGTGKETSIRDLATIVYQEARAPNLTPDYRAPRPGDVRRLIADASLAERMIDFSPRTSVREGVRKLLEYLRSQGSRPAELLQQIPEANWTTTFANLS
jgi:UDP-glucose 4-epimerase